MTRRFAVAAVSTALVGGGVGGAAAVLASRHHAAPAHAPPVAAAAAPRAKASFASNQIRLSRSESLRLVGWAQRFRACMQGRGVALGQPVAHPKEIDLALERIPSRAALLREVVVCGDGLGQPPRKSSLQLRPGKLVLYLPRQCLLDAKVARPAGT